MFQPFERTSASSAPDSSAPPPALDAHARTLVALSRTQSCVPVNCPQCYTAIDLPVIGLPSAGGGLALPVMSFRCSTCQLLITHQVLRVGRFLRDLLRVRAGTIPHFAGLGDNSHSNIKNAYGIPMSQALVNTAITKVMNPHNLHIDLSAVSVGDLGNKLEWSQDKVREKIFEQTVNDGGFIPIVEASLEGKSGRTTRRVQINVSRQTMSGAIMRLNRVYSVGTGLDHSLELAPAIIRQASFVTNMQKIGWLGIHRWTNPQDPGRYYFLQKSAARYREWELILSGCHADSIQTRSST